MTNPQSPDTMDKALFAHLLMMLSTSAMQQMGKLVNPATGKTETNLDAAQFSIDMIEMLARKSRGNLDDEERAGLEATLSTLQMTFVETSREAGRTAAGAAPAQPPPPAGSAQPPPAGEKPDAKDPKYHKSYG